MTLPSPENAPSSESLSSSTDAGSRQGARSGDAPAADQGRPTTRPNPPAPRTPESVTGVQLARGIGHTEAKGFWLDAWSYVLGRPAAVVSLTWIGIVLFFAIFSPLIANGHPIVLRHLDESGAVTKTTSPLIEHLTAADVALLVIGVLGPIWLFVPWQRLAGQRGKGRTRTTGAVGGVGATEGRGGAPSGSRRLLILLVLCLQGGLVVAVASAVSAYFMQRDIAESLRDLQRSGNLPLIASAALAVLIAVPFCFIPFIERIPLRVGAVVLVAIVAALITTTHWKAPLETFPYREMAAAGQVEASYTLIPFSPTQASTSWYHKPPGTTLSDVEGDRFDPSGGDATFILGTDGIGQDVLSQMLHASRLSISIGLVSTSIAVLIGITMGALMGYFGGFVDLALFRVVEIFMSIPVLFLLIVAAGVLPPEFRSTYTMMAIIGIFTWHGTARFTRAEFYKLRNQDFVQSARAVGLPLHAILFKHMLPNGVTPVLVEASFMIAAAILIEAILSFLGLGPVGQPSWGKLLSTATSDVGTFVWWLAIFPGGAIFLTVLAFTLVGEALRDAIDPKLKKARV